MSEMIPSARAGVNVYTTEAAQGSHRDFTSNVSVRPHLPQSKMRRSISGPSGSMPVNVIRAWH